MATTKDEKKPAGPDGALTAEAVDEELEKLIASRGKKVIFFELIFQVYTKIKLIFFSIF